MDVLLMRGAFTCKMGGWFGRGGWCQIAKKRWVGGFLKRVQKVVVFGIDFCIDFGVDFGFHFGSKITYFSMIPQTVRSNYGVLAHSMLMRRAPRIIASAVAQKVAKTIGSTTIPKIKLLWLQCGASPHHRSQATATFFLKML